MDQTQTALAVGMPAGMSPKSMFVAALVYWALMVLARWFMFKKADEKSWKALIPFYNDYVLYKLVWSAKSFWILCIAWAVMLASMVFSGQYIVSPTGELLILSTGGNAFLGGVSFFASLVVLFYTLMVSVKTALAYGKKTIFALGLLLIPNLFALILAFGSATYRGPQA